MKVFLAQQNYHIGNFALNLEKMLQAVEEGRIRGADLVVFSELSVCGYPPRDFLEFEDFILQAESSIATLAKVSGDIGILVGTPTRNPQKEGKDLLNSAVLLYDGVVHGIAHKSLLPNYDVFDEYRYFEPAYDWNVIEFKGKKIAITICEDIWNLGDNPLYRVCPMDKLMLQSPDLMINISASPFDFSHDEDRKEVVRLNVLKYKMPLIYCNAVGAQTEIVFDGGSLVFNSDASLFKQLNYFQEDSFLIDTNLLFVENKASNLDNSPLLNESMRFSHTDNPLEIIDYLTASDNIEQIHHALVLGIRDYFSKMGFKKAILGSSGGIDSAVVLALAAEALGAGNITSILMPSGFSSSHSVDDAVALSKNLGNPYHVIPIETIFETFLQTLNPLFEGTSFGVAEENIQSRSRGNLLMAIANKFGYVLLNTSNKSELATGYGTLYGDMAGGLSVLGDLYKVQVYALAKYINRNQEIIPKNIIVKEPSAELRPNQKDSDSLPDYSILDNILYLYVEGRKGPKEIIQAGFDAGLVKRVLKMVNINEYKRNQFCPIIRVSTKAFGVGRRLPIVAKYLS
jgi:NAD+ synthase (glutamine-hydrolysing)